MRQYYTYIYWDSLKAEPFYIGKGTGNRAHYHLKYGNKDNSYFDRKIKKMLKESNEPEIKIINVKTESEALELEKFLIAEIGRKKLGLGSLLNMTDGGDGLSGHIITENQR